MAIYCYSNEGRTRTVERSYSIGTNPRQIQDDGETMYLDVSAQQTLSRSGSHGYPRLSRALGCSPAQIPQMKAAYKKHGIDIDYTRDGKMILDSYRQRQRVIKAGNFVDLQ